MALSSMTAKQETAPVRTPTAVTSEDDDDTAKVKLIMPGILRGLGSKTKPKNGTLQIEFKPWGLSAVALIQLSKKPEEYVSYQYKVRRLPSEINCTASSYKIKKDLVVLRLVKKRPNSWCVSVGGGLEQAPGDSSGDEDKG